MIANTIKLLLVAIFAVGIASTTIATTAQVQQKGGSDVAMPPQLGGNPLEDDILDTGETPEFTIQTCPPLCGNETIEQPFPGTPEEPMVVK